MLLPRVRGPVSAAVIGLLRAEEWCAGRAAELVADAAAVASPLDDGDLQLALACCYEMHYQGFADATLDEWDTELLRARAALERPFETALRCAVPATPSEETDVPVDQALRALVADDDGPSMSTHVLRHASVDQVRELLVQRSVYQLKEADPHTWAIPRLRGRAKAALVEIQHDEYGAGRVDAMHSTLFGRAMAGLGLDAAYGAYWDDASPATLAAVNAMSLLGLHRRLRGALVGHLAALEMTSTAPMRRYANGLRRLGFGTEVTAYFDEHVEADAVHEQIASVDLAGALVADEPDLHADVLWGARVCLALDAAAAADLLARWDAASAAGAA